MSEADCALQRLIGCGCRLARGLMDHRFRAFSFVDRIAAFQARTR